MDAPAPSVDTTVAVESAPSKTAAKDEAKSKIIAEHRKAKAKEAIEVPAPEPTDPEKPAEDPKPEEPAAKKTAKPVNRGKFTSKIATLEKELAAARGESKSEFLKALRADPGILFREITDDPEIMVKLAEARQLSLDPVEQAKREGQKALDAIKKERLDAEAATEAAKARANEAGALSGISSMLRSGIRDDAGKVLVAAKWPIAAAMAADEEDIVWTDDDGKHAVSIPSATLRAYKALRDPLSKKLGRPVNEQETATLLEIALDKIEARQAGRGKYYAKAEGKTGGPKTITSRGAPGRPASTTTGTPKGASKADRKVAILENYRQQRLRERMQETA
jgi:hypothetical protein